MSGAAGRKGANQVRWGFVFDMRTQGPILRDRVLAWFADRQHGVVSREQLLAAGVSAQAIGRAVRAGRLRPLFRGVYAVGHIAVRREGWWMGALLACGGGAALSHQTAATLWELHKGSILPVALITPTDRGRKQSRIKVHRTRLHETETLVRDGLRVTTPARTIVDLAATLSARSLREMVERAQDGRRFDPDGISTTLARVPRQAGARPLMDLLELMQPDTDNARSHLERLFLSLVRHARLPRPEVNREIADRKRDFVWPRQRLVVEVDGYRYHSSRQAKRRDHRRDRQLTTLDWRPVRFTYEDVAFEPAQIARELTALLES